MAEPALATPITAAPAQPQSMLHVVEPASPAPSRPAPRLEIPAYELAAALRLEHELGISHVLAQVLLRRGLSDPDAAKAFLDADEDHPPSAFTGMDTAVELIQRHLTAQSRITIHGDYDVDGVCATSIMVRSLRALGADVDWFLPGRLEDGYGLAGGTLARLAARGTRLLITVDCAVTAVEEVELARQLGMDVLVSDHHQPRADGRLPDCPVLHPSLCGYPGPGLCGSGVAYKLAQALAAPSAGEEIELVALATVADLMPLTGENRTLVRRGLAALSQTARPGLRALMEVSRADPSALDTGTLAFRLAPRINAAGRLRRADAGVELLLTADPDRAKSIALELDQLNAERRAVEQRITWEAEAQLAELGQRPAYVLAGEGWHPGVVGIVASRIVERCHRPAIVIGMDGQVGTGSGRSIPGFDLLAALHDAAPHLQRYGGHQAAAGLTIAKPSLKPFTQALEAHARSVLTPDMLAPVETIDAVVSGSELGLGLAEELELLEPTGIGNPGVRLLVPGGRLREARPMGEGGRHLRFTLSSAGSRMPAVAFGCDGRLEVGEDEPADATFRLERNHWNGAVEPRLLLRRAWPCRPRPIALLGEPDDYVLGLLAELRYPLEPAAELGRPAPGSGRRLLDRRGEGALAVLTDAGAAGGEVLAVCSDVPRRQAGLRSRIGGFSLICYHALEHRPELALAFTHLVALDPPGHPRQALVLEQGSGFAHLAWGEPELRFAQQMHELEYGLRASLVALYRGLRQRGQAAGPDLERLLRGEDTPGRPVRLSARLVRVLSELGLVNLDTSRPCLSIAGEAPTALERSTAYRAYAQRHQDGRRFLSSANLLPSR